MRTNEMRNNSAAYSHGPRGILLSTKARPEYGKNINTILMYRKTFYQLHAAQRQLPQPLNNLEKWIPQK